MALVLADRVKESTSTIGTGPYALAGAENGFQTFAVIGDGNTTYYSCTDGSAWEVGIGTYASSGTTLARTVILKSSNGNAAVSWGVGGKLIFVTQPSEKAVYLDANGSVEDLDVSTHVDFHTTTNPSYSEGRLFYDKSMGALGFYNEEADITLQIGQEEYVRVYNNTGSTITNGTPVYIPDEFNGVPIIAAASANDTFAKSQAVGITTHDIENTSYGYVTVRGIVNGVNTSSLDVGKIIYIAPNGGLQSLAPTYPYYPTEMGECLVSDASNGSIYVRVNTLSHQTMRVTDSAHFDSDLTIGGNLTVLGTQTIENSTNIAIDGAFNYLNSGDTIGNANTAFVGSGVDDATLVGHFNGTTSVTYYVRISADQAAPDKFEWSKDNFSTIEATDIDITTQDQLLDNNISVRFNSVNGHDTGDVWSGTAAPVNVDTGIATNRNTGASGVGYTHVGLFFDVSSGKWTLFDEYDPEPEGEINLSDASFSLATLLAETFEGALSGNATTASRLQTSRTITLSGDVSGNTSFDGSGNITIEATVADESHSHDSTYVKLSGSTMTGQLAVTEVAFVNWTITESNTDLYFATGGTNMMKLDSNGNLDVVGNVNANAVIT